MKRKLKTFQQKYSEGTMWMEEIERSLYSWLGHAEYGNTYHFRRKMLEDTVFNRGNDENEMR